MSTEKILIDSILVVQYPLDPLEFGLHWRSQQYLALCYWEPAQLPPTLLFGHPSVFLIGCMLSFSDRIEEFCRLSMSYVLWYQSREKDRSGNPLAVFPVLSTWIFSCMLTTDQRQYLLLMYAQVHEYRLVITNGDTSERYETEKKLLLLHR